MSSRQVTVGEGSGGGGRRSDYARRAHVVQQANNRPRTTSSPKKYEVDDEDPREKGSRDRRGRDSPIRSPHRASRASGASSFGLTKGPIATTASPKEKSALPSRSPKSSFTGREVRTTMKKTAGRLNFGHQMGGPYKGSQQEHQEPEMNVVVDMERKADSDPKPLSLQSSKSVHDISTEDTEESHSDQAMGTGVHHSRTEDPAQHGGAREEGGSRESLDNSGSLATLTRGSNEILRRAAANDRSPYGEFVYGRDDHNKKSISHTSDSYSKSSHSTNESRDSNHDSRGPVEAFEIEESHSTADQTQYPLGMTRDQVILAGTVLWCIVVFFILYASYPGGGRPQEYEITVPADGGAPQVAGTTGGAPAAGGAVVAAGTAVVSTPADARTSKVQVVSASGQQLATIQPLTTATATTEAA